MNSPAAQIAEPHCRYCGGLCGPRGYCRRVGCVERAAADRAKAKAEKVRSRRIQRCSFCQRLRSHKHFAKTCGEPACRAAYLQARAFAKERERLLERTRPLVLWLALAAGVEEAKKAADRIWRQVEGLWVADVSGQRLALEPDGTNWLVWVGGRVAKRVGSVVTARHRALELSGALGRAA